MINKYKICLGIILFYFVLVNAISGCAPVKLFEIKMVSKLSDSDFEAISHLEHCFYKSIDLGQCRYLSVSPSNRIALIQDALSGRLFLFYAKSMEKRWVSNEYVGDISKVQWYESESRVLVVGSGFKEEFKL